ncbi:MAG: RNA-binding domain-containing protein [Nitrososphaerales archaeon]
MSKEDIDIIAESQVEHTESREKVAAALLNLFGKSGELRLEDDRVVFLSSERASLQLLKDQFRDRRVRAAARRLLLSTVEDQGIQAVLLLNKQAATVGIAALCDDPRESPLGPIVLRIRYQNILELIDWLTKGYDSKETS